MSPRRSSARSRNGAKITGNPIIVMQPDADEAAIAAVEAKILAARPAGSHFARHRAHADRRGRRRAQARSRDVRSDARRREVDAHRQAVQDRGARVAQGEHGDRRCRQCRSAATTVQVIAGPCSVETAPQMAAAAAASRPAGARLMRGGAFKPRTSPYAFQGEGVDGLELLQRRGRSRTGLPIVTELMDARMLDTFLRVRRRRDPDRHAQHAEFRPAEGSRPRRRRR